MMDFYCNILILCGFLLAVGSAFSLIGAVIYILSVDVWEEIHTNEVIAPLIVFAGAVIILATLGLPLLIAFLYKCKKLFWSKK